MQCKIFFQKMLILAYLFVHILFIALFFHFQPSMLTCLLEGKSQFLLPRISDIRQLSGKLSIFNFFPLMCQKYYHMEVSRTWKKNEKSLFCIVDFKKWNNTSAINNVCNASVVERLPHFSFAQQNTQSLRNFKNLSRQRSYISFCIYWHQHF